MVASCALECFLTRMCKNVPLEVATVVAGIVALSAFERVWGGVFSGGQLMCKNICTVSMWRASHRYESACDFSGGWHKRLSSCIGCSCVSFSNQLDPCCWDLLSILQLTFPWFSFVGAQQGLITTETTYVLKRESFKNRKWRLNGFYRPSKNCSAAFCGWHFFNRLMFYPNIWHFIWTYNIFLTNWRLLW